jgi:hypothetical protein
MYIYINIIKHGVVMPKYIDRCIYICYHIILYIITSNQVTILRGFPEKNLHLTWYR